MSIFNSCHLLFDHFQFDLIHVCPTSNAKEAEVEWFYEDLQELLELTPKKDGLEWVNLTQITIISTTMGKNPLEEME